MRLLVCILHVLGRQQLDVLAFVSCACCGKANQPDIHQRVHLCAFPSDWGSMSKCYGSWAKM